VLRTPAETETLYSRDPTCFDVVSVTTVADVTVTPSTNKPPSMKYDDKFRKTASANTFWSNSTVTEVLEVDAAATT
jgi:hypothetical protein